MEHFKLSTSRDFRINGACLEAALQENEAEDDEERSLLGVSSYICIYECMHTVAIIKVS